MAWSRLLLRALGSRSRCRAGSLSSAGRAWRPRPSPVRPALLMVANHISWLDPLVMAAGHALAPAGQERDRPLAAHQHARRGLGRHLHRSRTAQPAAPARSARSPERCAPGDTVVAFPEGTTWCGQEHGRVPSGDVPGGHRRGRRRAPGDDPLHGGRRHLGPAQLRRRRLPGGLDHPGRLDQAHDRRGRRCSRRSAGTGQTRRSAGRSGRGAGQDRPRADRPQACTRRTNKRPGRGHSTARPHTSWPVAIRAAACGSRTPCSCRATPGLCRCPGSA